MKVTTSLFTPKPFLLEKDFSLFLSRGLCDYSSCSDFECFYYFHFSSNLSTYAIDLKKWMYAFGLKTLDEIELEEMQFS